MLTPRQKLEEAAEKIANRHGYDLASALHSGRSYAVMVARREIYRFVLDHYKNNWAAAARFLEKDPRTVQIVLRGRKSKCAGQ